MPEKGSGRDNRKGPRVRVNLPSRVRGPKGFFSHSRCMTLSPYGVEMLLDWPIEPAQSYTLEISMTAQVVLQDVKAICVRCVKVGNHYRAAMSFVNLQGPTFYVLEALCAPRLLARG